MGNKINLFKIGEWYRHHGLVGETAVALLQTIVAVSRKPIGFGIEAPSGSGKSVSMDLLLGDANDDKPSLINKKHTYFKDAGSSTSFFYDKRVNDKDIFIIVFKELQKDKSDNTIEAIKSITEGKSANRKVTDVTTDDVKEQTIRPRTVMYSLAIENTHKPDIELRRRCIVVTTDVSKEQTVEVLKTKASMRWDLESTYTLSLEEEKEIRDFVNSILLLKFKVINPFAEEFSKYIAELAPDQKVRSMAEHFWDVMEGVTKLNVSDRTLVNGNTIICSIQDLLMTLDVYKHSFVRDVYSIPPMGDIILQGFSDANNVDQVKKGSSDNSLMKYSDDSIIGEDWYEINHVRKAIKEKQKVVLAQNVVYSICRQLVDAGYLEDWKDGKATKYKVLERLKTFSDPCVDELIEEAGKLVKAKFPSEYQNWVLGNKGDYQHPITGEIVQLCEDLEENDI